MKQSEELIIQQTVYETDGRIIHSSNNIMLLFAFIWILSFKECLLLTIPRDIGVVNERELGSNIQGGSCSVQFQNCVKSHFGLFDSFQRNYTSGSSIQLDTESVDILCSNSSAFQECLKNVKDVCRSDNYWGYQKVHYYISIVTYICSQDGMKALLKTQGSRCDRTVNSDRLRVQCEMDAHRTFQLEKGITDMSKQKLHCSFVKQQRECSVKAVTRACGAAIADFLEGIDQQINAERYEYERKLNKC